MCKINTIDIKLINNIDKNIQNQIDGCKKLEEKFIEVYGIPRKYFEPLTDVQDKELEKKFDSMMRR